jgi:hypothetical protein
MSDLGGVCHGVFLFVFLALGDRREPPANSAAGGSGILACLCFQSLVKIIDEGQGFAATVHWL